MDALITLTFYLIQLTGKVTCLQYAGLRNFAGRAINLEGTDYTIKTEFPSTEPLQVFFTREIEIYDQIINHKKPLGSLEKLHFNPALQESMQAQFEALFHAILPVYKGIPLKVTCKLSYNTLSNSCKMDYSTEIQKK